MNVGCGMGSARQNPLHAITHKVRFRFPKETILGRTTAPGRALGFTRQGSRGGLSRSGRRIMLVMSR